MADSKNMSDYAYLSLDGSLEDRQRLGESPILAFDVEGSGTNMGKDVPYGFSLACEPTGAYYADINSTYFRQLLSDPNRLYIAHNAKYDRSMMKKAGVMVDNLCDTMIAAHLLWEQKLSLKDLASKHIKMDVKAFDDVKRDFAQMSLQEMAEYSGPHAIAALRLWGALELKLKTFELLDIFWKIEMPLIPVLSDMELNGVMVDGDRLRSLGEQFDEKIALRIKALDILSQHPGMKHNSPNQVRDLLFNEFKLSSGPRTGKKKKPSVNAEYLVTIKDKHPYIPYYLRFKEYKKLKSTYVDGLLGKIVNGRIHCSFNQAGTETGRLSCSNPNLQNIPMRSEEGKRIRTAFVAPPGHMLVKADYNQLELRVMAHCSKCVPMIKAFLNGEDVHEQTAIRVFGGKKRRDDAKTLNFQIIYGGGDAKERQKFFAAYPEIKRWTDITTKQAREAGYVQTLGGRIRLIPEWEFLYSLQRGDKKAISHIIQGSAAEAVKIGMRRAWEALKDSRAKMILQVHDELVFEVPEKEVPDVVKVLEKTLTYGELLIPLTVSISTGKNWGQMEGWKGASS